MEWLVDAWDEGIQNYYPTLYSRLQSIEHFFLTVEAKFTSNDKIISLPKMAGFINKRIEEIPKEKFVNYFKWSFETMFEDMIKF